MSNLLVILVLFLTTFLSSLFSPVSGQDELPLFSFEAWYGSQSPSGAELTARPGGIIEPPVPVSNVEIRFACIKEGSQDCSTRPSRSSLPKDTQLRSTNKAVASVSEGNSDTVIQLNSAGVTILQLRQHRKILASYVLLVTPDAPGTLCRSKSEQAEPFTGVVDCSGSKCVGKAEIQQRLIDGVCHDGREHDEGKEPIDLTCASFLPNFLQNVAPFREFPVLADLFNILDNLDPNVGNCSPEESCMAQFGTAPGYQFCPAITTSDVCSFNAITGKDMPTGLGTCADMCQRFHSLCRGALDNETPGCTWNPKSRDTCETPRHTEICLCERRR